MATGGSCHGPADCRLGQRLALFSEDRWLRFWKPVVGIGNLPPFCMRMWSVLAKRTFTSRPFLHADFRTKTTLDSGNGGMARSGPCQYRAPNQGNVLAQREGFARVPRGSVNAGDAAFNSFQVS